MLFIFEGYGWKLEHCDDGELKTENCSSICYAQGYSKVLGCGYNAGAGGDACECTNCSKRYRCNPDEKKKLNGLSYDYTYIIEECLDESGEWIYIMDCSTTQSDVGLDCYCEDSIHSLEDPGPDNWFAYCGYLDKVCEGAMYSKK